MTWKSVLLFNAAFCLLLVSVSRVSAADCSSLEYEVTSGVLNYLSNVTIVVPESTAGRGWTIILKFDQPFTGIGIWVGSINSYGDLMYATMKNNEGAPNSELNKGDVFTFNYRIHFGRDIPAPPKLISLEFYDIQLCKYSWYSTKV